MDCRFLWQTLCCQIIVHLVDNWNKKKQELKTRVQFHQIMADTWNRLFRDIFLVASVTIEKRFTGIPQENLTLLSVDIAIETATRFTNPNLPQLCRYLDIRPGRKKEGRGGTGYAWCSGTSAFRKRRGKCQGAPKCLWSGTRLTSPSCQLSLTYILDKSCEHINRQTTPFQCFVFWIFVVGYYLKIIRMKLICFNLT